MEAGEAEDPEGEKRDHLEREEDLGHLGGGPGAEEERDGGKDDPEEGEQQLDDRRGVVPRGDESQGVGGRRDGDGGYGEEVGEDQDPRLVAGCSLAHYAR